MKSIEPILLVNTDLPEIQSSKTLPLTMYFIGGLLRKFNHEVEVIDPMIYRTKIIKESIYDVVLRKSCVVDIICLSINSFSVGYMLKIVKLLNENGFTGKIILGGVHATHCPENIIKNIGVDFVVAGEAEETLPKLIKCIEEKIEVNIPNVYAKGKKTVKSNKLLDITTLNKKEFVFPAYDLVPKGIYESITIETSRGCFGNCSFCSIPNKNCWRSFPKQYVLDNINQNLQLIKDRFEKKSIIFTDDCFTMNINRACDLLTEFSNMEIHDYPMLIEARLGQLRNERLIECIKKLKNITVQVGIECGYDEGLKKINKGISINEVKEASKIFYKHGISKNIFFSFIIGFPWETAENCMKSLEFMSYIKKEYGIAVNCSWWIPVPSVDFEILKKMNKDINDDIFNEDGWIEKVKKFNNIRPLITKNDEYIFNEKIYIDGLNIM